MSETVYLINSRSGNCWKQCIWTIFAREIARNSVSSHFFRDFMLETVFLMLLNMDL